MRIESIQTRDARFALAPGEGADAVHRDPVYAYATTLLRADDGTRATGIAFTLGGGNDLVCRLIDELAAPLVGRDIGELMSEFGAVQRQIADHPKYRWLGPHKGAVHLALASITNACWDLWAKQRSVPLWRLLLDLTPEQLVDTLDLSYVEDVLPREAALAMLREAAATRAERESVLREGYPGYDTSIGWFDYPDDQVRDNARRAIASGFTAMKLKVGSRDLQRDLRRVSLLREVIGSTPRLMVDANQQWSLAEALRFSLAARDANLFWIEEPTHPDDVIGHQTLARAVAPLSVALGEHVPNRVLFKNFIQAQACQFVQVDAVRVAGVSEFLVVSLMAKRFGLQVVPHVGDMGQLHQHLVLFNHVGIGLDRVFLEHIPHLRDRFIHPVRVEAGVYRIPQEPGAGCDLREDQ